MLRKYFDEGDDGSAGVSPVVVKVIPIDFRRVCVQKTPTPLSAPFKSSVDDDDLKELQFAQCQSDLRNLRKLAA
jgi:hypothetical protein